MFSVDFLYFDTETGRLRSDIGQYFDVTVCEEMQTETPDEVQRRFLEGLNAGALDDDLRETDAPTVYAVCPVKSSATGDATGPAVIGNIVLSYKHRNFLPAVRAQLLEQSPDTLINIYYRDI